MADSPCPATILDISLLVDSQDFNNIYNMGYSHQSLNTAAKRTIEHGKDSEYSLISNSALLLLQA